MASLAALRGERSLFTVAHTFLVARGERSCVALPVARAFPELGHRRGRAFPRCARGAALQRSAAPPSQRRGKGRPFSSPPQLLFLDGVEEAPAVPNRGDAYCREVLGCQFHQDVLIDEVGLEGLCVSPEAQVLEQAL